MQSTLANFVCTFAILTMLRCTLTDAQDTDSDLELPPSCLEAIFAPCVQSILELAHKQLGALEGTCDKVCECVC